MVVDETLSSIDTPELTAALQRYFGFASFRAEQVPVVQRALAGKDTLALMPTGAGKSLCYQLTAMLRDRPTLVISPLIALMKDQVDNLPPLIAERACFFNSSLTGEDIEQRMHGLVTGKYHLVYAAPERLRQRSFVAALRSVNIGLVVVDEVHCVSMWGHDFRPDYLYIRRALETLGDPSVLGLTATATPDTEIEIARGLGRNLDVVRSSVVRENLRYEVLQVDNEEDRRRAATEVAQRIAGAGIVYARSRDKCEQTALLLQRQGIKAQHYHAGLESRERSRVQESFLRGETRVIVATTAFGMGIDKPDIRWVVLYNYPNSLESYVQMVGRAGRDGEPSTCILLAGDADAGNLRKFARSDQLSIDQLRSVYSALRHFADGEWSDVTAEELSQHAGLPDSVQPRVLVGMLEQAELVRRSFDSGRSMHIELLRPPADTRDRMAKLLDRFDKQARERAQRMILFAESSRCRHAQVAEHFGEHLTEACGRCDICDPPERSVSASRDRPLPDDIAAAILEAIDGLRWPLGVSGLVAMLKGSVAAPASARDSAAFGVLASAPEGTIKRWLQQLTETGHLEPYISNEGYRLLRVERRRDLPVLIFSGRSRSEPRAQSSSGPSVPLIAQPLSAEELRVFERLRSWRHERAMEQNWAAYMVLSDQVLRDIARSRPATEHALASISGVGPIKMARYGRELLELLRKEVA